ncbi:sigma factor-like helix-turn-helix DNA-binding protein [Kitasatospora sp. NPDC048545]|uniref:sigma factor-like helix-turn-helix DNA-binding protein n=1 Tax=Kitasatospora sp. NPDC048545 TaxID=3157208 RepID=UPI0034108C3E
MATGIHDALERPPPGHRAVLTLRHIEGLDEQSASEILDVPLGTARSRLFRGQPSPPVCSAARRTRRSAPPCPPPPALRGTA